MARVTIVEKRNPTFNLQVAVTMSGMSLIEVEATLKRWKEAVSNYPDANDVTKTGLTPLGEISNPMVCPSAQTGGVRSAYGVRHLTKRGVSKR